MTNVSIIEKVLKENPNGDAESQPLNGESGEGAKTSEEILAQMVFIGTKITEVSTTIKATRHPTRDAIVPIK